MSHLTLKYNEWWGKLAKYEEIIHYYEIIDECVKL